MSFISQNNPCLCGSGLDYLYCCGAPNRKELNRIASLRLDTDIPATLSVESQYGLEHFAEAADWFPVKQTQDGTTSLVKMSPFWFSESTFLDANRIMGTYTIEVDSHWLLEKSQNVKWQYTPIIFHTAFCGSTLMSKALASIGNCLPLREPDIMGSLLGNRHSLFNQTGDDFIKLIMGLLSRRFEPGQIPVIKANDYANVLMSSIVRLSKNHPILYMYVPIEEFFAACLKDSGRQQWIKDRYHFVQAKLSTLFPQLENRINKHPDLPFMIASYWSYSVALYQQVYTLFPTRVRCLDFNQMLSHPHQVLDACQHWFNIEPITGVDRVQELRDLFGVYSKGQHAYGPQQRRAEIDSVIQQHRSMLEQTKEIVQDLFDSQEDMFPGQLLSIVKTQKPKSFFQKLFQKTEAVE